MYNEGERPHTYNEGDTFAGWTFYEWITFLDKYPLEGDVTVSAAAEARTGPPPQVNITRVALSRATNGVGFTQATRLFDDIWRGMYAAHPRT